MDLGSVGISQPSICAYASTSLVHVKYGGQPNSDALLASPLTFHNSLYAVGETHERTIDSYQSSNILVCINKEKETFSSKINHCYYVILY